MTVHPSSRRLVQDVAREDFAPQAPDVLDRILQRRAAGERVILPTGAVAEQRSGVAGKIAAGLLLALAGAAAALPGSPIRRAIVEIFTRAPRPAAPAVPTNGAVNSAAVPPSATDTPQAGVSIPAGTRPMWVGIDSLSARVRVVIRIHDRNEMEVRGTGASARATFRPREDGISVAQVHGGELRIDVPARAPAFSLIVRGVEIAGVVAGRFRGSSASDSLVVIAKP